MVLAMVVGISSSGPAATTAQEASTSPTSILLLGGDAGPQRVGLRSDTMMVASIDPETGRTALFGVPRNLTNTPLPEPWADLFVCGCWESLLNELYPFVEANADLFGGGDHAGATVMMATIGDLLGLQIDYYALVDMEGFVRVIDALGGITIDVPVQESVLISPAIEGEGWQQFVISAGRQTLDGRTALAYARTRVDSGDYSRMARQRCIIGAMAREADVETLVLNYPLIARSIQDAVRTNVPLGEIPDLIELLGQIDFTQFFTIGFTTDNFMSGYAGQPYYPIPDPIAIRSAVNTLLSGSADNASLVSGSVPSECAWT